MSGKVRWLTICTLLALLVAGWVWRYTTMNAFYASKTSSRREIYPVGEAVPFGTDVYAGKSRAEGYFLRVDSFEIVDREEYAEKNGLDPETMRAGDRLALVHVTLVNKNSEAEGVSLTEFQLHGVDNYAGLNWDLLLTANPVLGENYGIRLSKGTEYALTIPYDLDKQYFSTYTWNHMNRYAFYFQVTVYPTAKDIQVQ